MGKLGAAEEAGDAQSPSTAGVEVVKGQELEEKHPVALQNWLPIQVLSGSCSCKVCG